MSRTERNVDVERARDELFSHIHRCGVLRATAEHQVEWMDDTVGYISERYPQLSEGQLDELRTMGLRFCRPVINHTQDSGPETGGEAAESEAAAA